MRAKIAQPTAKTLVTQLELVGLRGKLVGVFIYLTRVQLVAAKVATTTASSTLCMHDMFRTRFTAIFAGVETIRM